MANRFSSHPMAWARMFPPWLTIKYAGRFHKGHFVTVWQRRQQQFLTCFCAVPSSQHGKLTGTYKCPLKAHSNSSSKEANTLRTSHVLSLEEMLICYNWQYYQMHYFLSIFVCISMYTFVYNSWSTMFNWPKTCPRLKCKRMQIKVWHRTVFQGWGTLSNE